MKIKYFIALFLLLKSILYSVEFYSPLNSTTYEDALLIYAINENKVKMLIPFFIESVEFIDSKERKILIHAETCNILISNYTELLVEEGKSYDAGVIICGIHKDPIIVKLYNEKLSDIKITDNNEFKILNNTKAPVYALSEGIVSTIGFNSLNGVFILANYSFFPYQVKYSHFQSTMVYKKGKLLDNSLLGYTGMTGNVNEEQLGIEFIDFDGTFIFQEKY